MRNRTRAMGTIMMFQALASMMRGGADSLRGRGYVWRSKPQKEWTKEGANVEALRIASHRLSRRKYRRAHGLPLMHGHRDHE